MTTLSSSAEAKNEWSYTPTSTHAFMVCTKTILHSVSSVKQRTLRQRELAAAGDSKHEIGEEDNEKLNPLIRWAG
jgi:hypothetical protein